MWRLIGMRVPFRAFIRRYVVMLLLEIWVLRYRSDMMKAALWVIDVDTGIPSLKSCFRSGMASG